MKDCETCCGFGGKFSMNYGEISARMGDNKCQHMAERGGGAVVRCIHR